MRKLFLLECLLFCLLISGKAAAQNPCREVVGYYPNWQWYDRNKLVNPQSIDYSKYSILNYAFFKPLADGSITILDPWADKNLLLGPINWSVAPAGYDSAFDFGNPAYHQPGQQFSEICHQHNVKLLPSIGGWTLSDNFPSIAADPVKRQTFANQCVDLIDAFGFDGIDIDWEYPGYAEHSGTPQDITNYTLLLQEIRTAIDAYGQTINKPMLLTIAVGAAADKMDDVEWSNISQIVDIINLMAYDFFGTWDAETNHNAPLYAPASGDPEFNLHSSVQRLINVYNVDPQKITVGMAFYGRSSKTTGTPGLHVPINGLSDQTTFALDEGSPLYYNILSQAGLFTEHWDDLAKVPYLTGNGNLNTFLSYDNERSIGMKAEYVVDQNLRGAIIWEITGDYIETAPGSGVISGTPLADTLNNVFCHYQGGGSTNGIEENTTQLVVYPNPVNEAINLISGEEQVLVLTLTNAAGALVKRFEPQVTTMQFSVNDLSAGTYLMTIQTNKRITRQIIQIQH